ncbi:ATP synthase F1 subunit gamma [Polyangium spumosum]|uniref:ATP synthase gamma chain n=1 Tax=Polyangium spumosum TaxID=889282 RepID=A0A6N7PLF3_9BACT|nr:ATP synthase F1 subunit gamma [Polyangium spumosum]
MPSLKAIRKRITSVRSTQKITRAMKMVAGARLNRAQQRITELRPYAIKTQEVLAAITQSARAQSAQDGASQEAEVVLERPLHPLLVERPERRVMLVILTSDRGLCGAFNTNINKRAEREWKSRVEQGQEVTMKVIGRKGRDYMSRRNAPNLGYLPGVWEKLALETAQRVGKEILAPFLKGEVDSIYVIYNEFKSAVSQQVVVERLLPVRPLSESEQAEASNATEFIFEPTREALLDVLSPMYVDISLLRALYESMASEFGAKLTAMDAATKNAKEMVDRLTLQYNRARQAAITKELMEIIGGSEALKD